MAYTVFPRRACCRRHASQSRHAAEVVTGLAARRERGRLLLQLRGHVAEPGAGSRDAARGQQGAGQRVPLLRRPIGGRLRHRRQLLLEGAQGQRQQLATRLRFDTLFIEWGVLGAVRRAPCEPQASHSQVMFALRAQPHADAAPHWPEC